MKVIEFYTEKVINWFIVLLNAIVDSIPNTLTRKTISLCIQGNFKSVATFAPENIFLGEHSPESDIWSLGLTLWEIYSGGEFLQMFPRSFIATIEKI